MNVRLGAGTSHPSNLLRYSARNVRFRKKLPFNVHLLDVVFAATTDVPHPAILLQLEVSLHYLAALSRRQITIANSCF